MQSEQEFYRCLASDAAARALRRIQEIVADDTLSDRECFGKSKQSCPCWRIWASPAAGGMISDETPGASQRRRPAFSNDCLLCPQNR